LKRIANNVPNVNVHVNSNMKMATVSYGPGTFVTTTFHPNTKSVHINYGRTHHSIRRKGVGTMLRALITLAAKNAKVKVTQRSVYTKNTKNSEMPPSYYIMKKLGYTQITPIDFEYNASKTNNKNKLYSFVSKFA